MLSSAKPTSPVSAHSAVEEEMFIVKGIITVFMCDDGRLFHGRIVVHACSISVGGRRTDRIIVVWRWRLVGR